MAAPTNDDRTFARRHRRAKKGGSGSIVGLRVRDLAALFRDRYGDVLPDDDAGHDDVFVMVNHLAMYMRGDPAVRIAHWAETAAPWIAGEQFDSMLARIISRPIRWRADKLAQRLGLTAAGGRCRSLGCDHEKHQSIPGRACRGFDGLVGSRVRPTGADHSREHAAAGGQRLERQ